MGVQEPDTGKIYSDEPDELNEHWHTPGDPDGVLAAEEQRAWRERHPVLVQLPASGFRRQRRWTSVAIVAAALLITSLGSYWLGSQHTAEPAKKEQAAASQVPQREQAVEHQVSVPTKHYDSSNFSLGFDYPQTWTITDSTAKITVISPVAPLTTASGSVASGYVVFTIQNSPGSIPEYPPGGATAVLKSDMLTYAHPGGGQRTQTNLTYLSYGKPKSLNALYLTGDKSYQQGQQVPQGDVLQGSPLISVTFQNCAGSKCTSEPKPITLQASSWKSSQASMLITSMVQSLTLN